MLNRYIHYFVFLLISFFIVVSCATYYQQNIRFNDAYSKNKLQEATQILHKTETKVKNKDRILLNFNKGTTYFALKQYDTSIKEFTKADYYIEDYLKNPISEVLSLIVNPGIKPYQPEDHEKILIHFYQILNYINIGKPNDALVEAKRVNIKLQKLNDKYKDKQNKYSKDAFILNLTGLIYESLGDINNAFIAYRNAYDAYKNVYNKNFGLDAPPQLKKDLLRSAYLNNFKAEGTSYEKEFQMKYEHDKNEKDNGTLIVFWMNGLCPIKSEWSVNFTSTQNRPGWIVFYNSELGLNYAFYIGGRSLSSQNALKDINTFRVAFPQYVERTPVFKSAYIETNGERKNLEFAENINDIAFKTLKDRMLREFTNSLLRIAVKKSLEVIAKNKNEHLGLLVNLASTFTEKADTRNWQTLPYSISYTKLSLPPGEQTVKFITTSNRGELDMKEFTVNINKRKTSFYSISTVNSIPSMSR